MSSFSRNLATAACVILASVGSAIAGDEPPTRSTLDPVKQAERNPITNDKPAVNILEGAVLGNGALGAVVETYPDAVMIQFGHNAVWDQRMLPLDMTKLGTFAETLKRIEAIPTTLKTLSQDPWFKEYSDAGRSSYMKSYPRPLPCGGVALGFDRRKAEVLGYRVSIDQGLCEVEFLIEGKHPKLQIFTDMTADRLLARMVGEDGQPTGAPFTYLALLPDLATPKEFPRAASGVKPETSTVAFRQVLPYEEVTDPGKYHANPKDRAYGLSARVNVPIDPAGIMPSYIRLGAQLKQGPDFYLAVELHQGLADAVPAPAQDIAAPTAEVYRKAAADSVGQWHKFWEKSAVAIDDPLLEHTWYWNTYFLRCSLKPGSVAPGLYAIAQWPNKAGLWHGDYHFDYNTEQAFWSTFSSNHAELNLPYVDLVNNMLPVCRQWAHDYYGMRGAYYPVSCYPVEMRTYPYAPPVFNWMVCDSPWAIQGLWWHYLYTMDTDYLRERGFGPIKAVTEFLVDYIKRPDMNTRPWVGDRAHIFPSFPPELYHLMPGLPPEYNADTLVDLTLTRFAFNAYLRSCEALKVEADEAPTIKDVKDILARLPPYPTAKTPRGEVYVSVPAENPEAVHNVPVSLMSVFPGEDQGLHSPPEEYALAANTYRNQQNEGGNEVVFLNLQAARLGLLDLEKFKRELKYVLLPNGTSADKNLQIGGRFGFGLREYDWMVGLGLWFENFALPVVLNECLLQSYHGELRFCPNWPKDKDVEFRSLRAVGAFLVSARVHGGRVEWADITSEAGGTLKVVSPWKEGAVCVHHGERKLFTDPQFSIETQRGERIQLLPPDSVK